MIHGFKSFAQKTEINFDRGINLVIGPNGSGKSNVSDALCFVLGRLSAKSMRASAAKNLIFMGSKYVKPAREAYVELVFDNSDKGFSIEKEEVQLVRIVRRNGQSLYKINGETKTRTEIIEMLAQAGIDPHGFNLILQGQIQSIVRMHPEERRKIIEEVAGISIYESRKEKSLHELEKTDEKLKEIGAILRERTNYLRNLEKERAQALRFKELELTVKRSKASILSRKIADKQKELEKLIESIDEKSKQREVVKEKGEKIRQSIEELSAKISEINKHIQQATGFEQENLHTQIANLKAELEGLRVRRENYENRKNELERRINEMEKSIPSLNIEIGELKAQSPLVAKKAQELKKKKEELAILEEEKKRMLTIRSELNSIRERLKDKEKQKMRASTAGESILKQIEEQSVQLQYKNEEDCNKAIDNFKKRLTEINTERDHIIKNELENEKALSVSESVIERYHKIKNDLGKIDICPLCQTKITQDHINHVVGESDDKIAEAEKIIIDSKEKLTVYRERKQEVVKEAREIEQKVSTCVMELMRHRTLKDKQQQLKRAVEDEKVLTSEIAMMEEKRKNIEMKIENSHDIEDKYDAKLLEIEEISSRNEQNVDTTLLYKEREMENVHNVIKRGKKDLEDIEHSIQDISENVENKGKLLTEREGKEKELNERFKRMFQERDTLQDKIQTSNLTLNEMQNEIRQLEDQVNYLKLGKARFDAEKEAYEMEMSEYAGLEIIQGSMQYLEERMKKAQEALGQIGSINMRSLEVYDEIKKEYDAVAEKVSTLDKEKIEIMKIIEEIDKKKTRSFMKTFKAMNELFSQNFSKLSTKGVAYLEIENQEDVFAGGVNILVKLAKGKYFDVTSLSGGEQTLVALSLLFAIQEHKPYHFYIFDEIDAALDKRNSERLAALLNQYMKSGQYIVITHNDAIIMNANILYGVSMHDGVSKVLSLKVADEKKYENIDTAKDQTENKV